MNIKGCTHFLFFIFLQKYAILSILNALVSCCCKSLECTVRYPPVKGCGHFGHFAPDRAFGTYHKLFFRIKLA